MITPIRTIIALLAISLGISGVAALALVPQRPGGPPSPPGFRVPRGGGPESGGPALSKPDDLDDFVSRMMAFDADKDGTLVRAEISDDRVLRLFDLADANKDGKVTRAEVVALAEQEYVNLGAVEGPGPPMRGPQGMLGGPRPGEVLPARLRAELRLTADQERAIDTLQKDVDDRMATILTREQHDQMKAFRGPGGRPGGPPR